MDIGIFVKGLVLGLSIAAPVGPIGVLCIRRTLANGRLTGLVSGLGAATADALYGSIAAFGITLVSNVLVSQQMWLRLLGGVFLCYLGVRAFLSQAANHAADATSVGLVGSYLSTLLLTLTNPLTILSFAAIFAGVGLGSGADNLSAVLLVGGVFSGSALWWIVLSGGVSLFRSRFDLATMRWVNRISGGIITAFGIVALFSLGV